jgi:hypothetical protein
MNTSSATGALTRKNMPVFRRIVPVLLLLLLLAAGCSEEAVVGFFAGSIALMALAGILLFVLLVWAIVDLIRKDYPTEKKVIWLLVILIIPYLGAILYFILGRDGERLVR